jgi:hypothetical protein
MSRCASLFRLVSSLAVSRTATTRGRPPIAATSFFDGADTIRIRVDERSIAEIKIIATYQRQIPLRQAELPWRRVGHIEVVTLYHRVPGVYRRELR